MAVTTADREEEILDVCLALIDESLVAAVKFELDEILGMGARRARKAGTRRGVAAVVREAVLAAEGVFRARRRAVIDAAVGQATRDILVCENNEKARAAIFRAVVEVIAPGNRGKARAAIRQAAEALQNLRVNYDTCLYDVPGLATKTAARLEEIDVFSVADLLTTPRETVADISNVAERTVCELSTAMCRAGFPWGQAAHAAPGAP